MIRRLPRSALLPYTTLSGSVAGTSAVLPAARRRKVAVVIEAAFIALLNEAVTVVLRGTPVAPGADRKSVVEGKRVVVGGRRVTEKKGVPIASVTLPATLAV